jgi:hypothetical protein
MHTIDTGPFALACHPQFSLQAIRQIDVVVREAKNGGFILTFRLEGDISALRIPEVGTPRRTDNLWQHTCFEAFIMAGEGPAYREFNFSPAGAWAVYDFAGYRNGGTLENEFSPDIEVHKDADRLELVAEIPQGLLPHGNTLRMGLSAVVENVDAILSYWALRHPPGKPDFHHTDAFALTIEKR